MSQTRKPISLALQGGGAHGALSWGVLDRLLEDGRLDIKAITATSAGAMNAVALATGLANGGREGAREHLESFWKDVSNRSATSRFLTDMSKASSVGVAGGLRPFNMLMALMSVASPYDLNPFNYNPLREALEAQIDFDAVQGAGVDLYLTATNVETGRARIFSGEEVTLEATLASACLPQTFQAVEIDQVPYWDGGYVGNPSLYPLIYSGAPGDILLVLLNPLRRGGVPKTASEIQDRLNEINFNAALIGELRAIGFVQKLLDENWLVRQAQSQYRRLYLHTIQGGGAICELTLESKYDTSWDFLVDLRDRGRVLADEWLATQFEKVGRESSIDVRAEFLDD